MLRRVGLRIVVVEDDPWLADVLVDILRDEGHIVSRATDLDQVEGSLRWSTWDVCILDPSGTSFLELSAADGAQLRRVGALLPLVVITGRAWARYTDARSLGVRAILAKPFDLTELLQILDSMNTLEMCALASMTTQSTEQFAR